MVCFVIIKEREVQKKSGFISNLRISRKLLLLSAVFIVGFLVFGGYAYYTISTIKVNGRVYREIILQKDLVADILPPPEYIIEMYLTTLQMRDAKSAEAVDALMAKLQRLRMEYDERHTYWSGHLSEGTLKDTMVKESYDAAIQFFNVMDKDFIPAVKAGDTNGAASIVDQKLTPLYESHRASIDKVVEMANKESQRIEGMAASEEARSMYLLIAVATLILLLTLVLCVLITVGISRPMRQAVAFALKIAEGDFTQQLPVQQKDEVGKLADALNGMSVRLRAMVASIQESSEQVASSSEEISTSAEKLAEGSQSQASTLEETSASVEELTSVDQVAAHAQSQSSAVEKGSRSMTQVQKSIDEVSSSLAEILGLADNSVENAVGGARAVQQVVEGINLIAASAEKIKGIVDVISDIADQTNLLALNASIEAARAGEHGRGFAVVADEVSKLADRSASSTKEIDSLIKESVRNVTEGVKTAIGSQAAMEQIREASQKVKDMIGSLSDSMAQQVSAIHQMALALSNVSEMSQSISAATEEQTTNARQVSQAVENVNNLTQSAASAAEEMSASTEQLSSLAQELLRLMSQFKIEGRASSEGGVSTQMPRSAEISYVGR